MATERAGETGLQEALKEFAASPRYNFLKSFQVGPLLGEDSKSLGAIAQLTFEELVAQAQQVSSDVSALSAAQQRVLIAVLNAFSEGEAISPEQHGHHEQEEADSTTRVVLNSVQAELDIRERINRLKDHAGFNQIKSSPLRRFWDAASPSAPFEESLTLQQFVGLDISVLSKKRSMTGARMEAIAKALENALASLEGEAPESDVRDAEEAVTQFLERVQQDVAKPLKHRWLQHQENLSPFDMALVESFVRGCHEGAGAFDGTKAALQHFSHTFLVSDFLKVCHGAPISAGVQRKLQSWAHAVSLRGIVPLVAGALQGPGVHVSRIASIIQRGEPSQACYGIGAIILVRALGAHAVSVEGHQAPDMWTLNPMLVPLVVREARKSPKVSFPRALQSICPEMDPFLHSWLCALVSPAQGSKKRRQRG